MIKVLSLAFFEFLTSAEYKTENLHMFFRNLHLSYGKIVRLRTGLHMSVFLFDPEYIAKVYASEGQFPERISPPIMQAYGKRTKRKLLSMA